LNRRKDAHSTLTRHIQAIVVGGGISGLACAYALQKAGIEVQLVEASARPGGVIRSLSRNGYLLELGPQSFSGTAELRSLCADLGIADQLLEAPAKAPRYVLVNGTLQAVPMSPPAFFTSSLIDGPAKWALFRDIFGNSVPPKDDESVAAFVRRKFSDQLLDRLVGPFVSGVYAGDPEKLSLRSAFPQLHEAEKTSGSIVRGMMRLAQTKKGRRERPSLNTFREGNETLVRALAKRLGPGLRCDVTMTGFEKSEAGSTQQRLQFVVDLRSESGQERLVADWVILAIPTNVAAEALKQTAPESASVLEQIEYAPVAVVSLGYRKQNIGNSLNGFGFLVPRSSGLRILGTVWNSSLFPGRAPDGHVLLTTFVGGATDPSAATLRADDLVGLVHHEIAPLLSIKNDPTHCNVTIWPRALPQYNLGHRERLAKFGRPPWLPLNLSLVGNYLAGPAIGSCTEHALAVAVEVAKEFGRKRKSSAPL
jgi:oxygen-dependent protoporphyrinogen oxidase